MKKIFEFLKSAFGVALDIIYVVAAFICNSVKKVILIVVNVLKS